MVKWEKAGQSIENLGTNSENKFMVPMPKCLHLNQRGLILHKEEFTKSKYILLISKQTYFNRVFSSFTRNMRAAYAKSINYLLSVGYIMEMTFSLWWPKSNLRNTGRILNARHKRIVSPFFNFFEWDLHRDSWSQTKSVIKLIGTYD